MLDTALVGCGGMMPLPKRFLTSLLLRYNGRFALIDCGEGTQVSLKALGWGFKNIDVIMFTHFHADHIAGLPGLLLTIGNSGRTESLKLIGPKGLEAVVRGITIIARDIPFELEFFELGDDNFFEISGLNIKVLPVEHRTVCYAYSIEIKRPGKFDVLSAERLGLPKQFWSVLQRNETVFYNDKTYLPEMVMGGERKGLKITYCTDTRPVNGLVDFAKESDLFICEGIYGDDEKLPKAIEYKHMTFSEAALIASKANVKEMWLTHYSPSMTNPEDYIENARKLFANTKLGFDRKFCTLNFED